MLSKEMTIDKSTPIPLYFQLKNLLLTEIKNGSYKIGDCIPTEKDISEMFDISRTTVRQAITELVQEGWLYRIKSKGTFVAEPKIQQDFITKIESFHDQIIRSGMIPSTEVLDLKVMQADEDIAEHLQIENGEKVIYLHRKRLANDEPIVTIKTYLPHSMCSSLLDHDLSEERLYSILGQSGSTAILRIERTLEAVEATSEDAKELAYSVGKPIHYFHSVGYSKAGVPIEYSLARYRGDRNSFKVTVVNDI